MKLREEQGEQSEQKPPASAAQARREAGSILLRLQRHLRSALADLVSTIVPSGDKQEKMPAFSVGAFAWMSGARGVSERDGSEAQHAYDGRLVTRSPVNQLPPR